MFNILFFLVLVSGFKCIFIYPFGVLLALLSLKKVQISPGFLVWTT